MEPDRWQVLGPEPRGPQQVLRQAAQHLLDGPHLHFRSPQARQHLAKAMRAWAAETERGTLHPTALAAALDLADNILNDHRWSPERGSNPGNEAHRPGAHEHDRSNTPRHA